MRKKKPVIANTGKFFCFNNKLYNISNLYNNSVVEKARLMIDRWWEYIAKMYPIVLTVKQPKHTVKGAILLENQQGLISF
jgi:hypothetical protein